MIYMQNISEFMWEQTRRKLRKPHHTSSPIAPLWLRPKNVALPFSSFDYAVTYHAVVVIWFESKLNPCSSFNCMYYKKNSPLVLSRCYRNILRILSINNLRLFHNLLDLYHRQLNTNKTYRIIIIYVQCS